MYNHVNLVIRSSRRPFRGWISDVRGANSRYLVPSTFAKHYHNHIEICIQYSRATLRNFEGEKFVTLLDSTIPRTRTEYLGTDYPLVSPLNIEVPAVGRCVAFTAHKAGSRLVEPPQAHLPIFLVRCAIVLRHQLRAAPLRHDLQR